MGKLKKTLADMIFTIDEDKCLEYVKDNLESKFSKDSMQHNLVSIEDCISYAMTLAAFYFTLHHIPSMFYSIDFVERKYPGLTERIKTMARDLVTDRDEL